MVSAPPRKHYVSRDLESFPDDGRLRELVDGHIVEWDVPTHLHAFLVLALGAALRLFVVQHSLGRAVAGDAMVKIEGSEGDVRGADIAFYRRDRLPTDIGAPATVTVPDLVIGVLSPSDRADRVLDKVHDWLRAGVSLLWYVDPQTGGTTVYHAGQVTYVAGNENLTGLDVVPGFSVRIGDLLSEVSQPD